MMMNIYVSISSIISIIASYTHPQQGVKQSCCLSVCLSVDKILKQLKYVAIRSQKGTVTMFDLLFEGHSADSVIYNF